MAGDRAKRRVNRVSVGGFNRGIVNGNTTKKFFRIETVLLLVLLLEIGIFSITGSNFATRNNIFEMLRLSTEIGLLALVMTPIILTGGIDLSVGSLLGLSAIIFGKFWRDAHLPIALAAAGT